MIAVAYYTITGQTELFIQNPGLSAHKIDDAYPQYDMGEKYILITPSYQDFMMDSIVYFLTYKYNKKNLIGIIGCGNRNFNGTEEDVEKGRGNYHEHRALPPRFTFTANAR